MMNFKKSKVMGAMYAVAMACVGTGCMTAGGPQKQPWEKYEGFLMPNEENFQVKKEALENSGKVVEATMVPGENGQMIAVYGVRDKTFRERAIQHFDDNEAIYRNVDRAAQLSLDVTDTIYNIKGVHGIQKLNSTGRRQTQVLQSIQNKMIFR